MTKINLYIAVVFITLVTLTSCSNTSGKEKSSSDINDDHGATEQNSGKTEDEHGHGEELTLTQKQVDVLNIKIDTISKRNMSGFIEVNGELGVPPQNEAVVTSILGANMSSIKAIEGDKVGKGEILAYISHPDIITMQTNYLQTYNKLTFLEQDYNRQKKMYDEGVGSGRDYQQAESSFSSVKGLTKGYESQLRLLGISPQNVREGNIIQTAPIRSPIDGYIEKVQVKSGQYVQPQTPMFEIVNTEHIHADLMVFEKDISKVKNGQMVIFNIEALQDTELTAKIYSVGKSFEEGPKALHVHAEIENKDKNLIPGMYVSARIITENNLEQALPEDAVFQEGEAFYVFVAKKTNNGTWGFVPKEVIVKNTSAGYTAFDFKEEIEENVLIAHSGAYYLMAEMKKSEAEHSH
ncbi:efflux RND transporter periplasmic adaptor subunit [Aquimarina sediminis]|uniref:efflux RND transporter periplasmic adaptor subunit n=1 Tax=Aquimarina sediminis TaxID=2070536 RepID=UPI000CA05D46|nr:efflux RND transporter periplasmic adaptor subunit [Aquimarina sediminis]